MNDNNKKSGSKPSLHQAKETMRRLTVRTGVQTGPLVVFTMECYTRVNCNTGPGCLILSGACAKD